MKVNSISKTFNINNKNIKKQSSQMHSTGVYMSYPANYYVTHFKGANISKMYEEYNWYINHDHVPAIKSFLKIIRTKEEMDEFLTHILNSKDRSYQLIDSVVSLPRQAKDIMQKLKEKVGENSKNVMTFLYDSPYNKAYTNYIKEKYNQASTIIELLKIRPDWSEQTLLNKNKLIHGDSNFVIGKIPKQIPKEHLEKILSYIKTKADVGVKMRKQIDDLILDGRTYQFLYYTEGKSSKNVFRVSIPALIKKYIIKFDDYENRSLDNAFSLGTLAKIDGYLTANRRRNSAPLCYYNHNDNYSIYKYIEHSHIDEPYSDLQVVKKHLPDFQALGLDYNDTVGYKNFFTLNEHSLDTSWRMEGYQEALNKNEWISVDNDHVTYNNRLQPSVNGFHKPLPNGMGGMFM